jgi:hypothetical protein
MSKGATLGPRWRSIQLRPTVGGKLFRPVSIPTRQTERALDRKAAFDSVNEQYGPEPRRARRGIARVWARNLMRDRRKTREARAAA